MISHSILTGALSQRSIDEVFEHSWWTKADVVKFTWRTATLDDIWPLLAATMQKRKLPLGCKGIGPSGLAFSLLGQRHGAP